MSLNAQRTGETGLKGPIEIPSMDPEILPYATGNVPTEETPEGSEQEVSQTYTLEDEQEGETLTGTKDMRAEGDNEKEDSSKRPKRSLTPTKTIK